MRVSWRRLFGSSVFAIGRGSVSPQGAELDEGFGDVDSVKGVLMFVRWTFRGSKIGLRFLRN